MEFWIFFLFICVFSLWVQSRIRRRNEDERFANVIEALNRLEPRLNELKKLETRVHELEQRLTSATPPPTTLRSTEQPAVSQPPTPAAPTPPPPKPVELPPPAAIPPPQIPKPAAPVPPPPPSPTGAPPPAPQPPKPTLHPPAPPSLPLPPKPVPVSAREFSSQIEETLGKNWLNKLGIIALVIGISLFLGYKFPSLSNPAKIALGYCVSFLILGTGVYLERSDRYRIFARALIGGGWALTFFVTYAMHFVPYTRVLDTQWVDLVLLFAVAVVMVVHTLRYDSQVVTGLAFLLAFFTVGISQNTIYSLSAGAILACGLVAIVHRRQWFELEVFGILASYINHFIWLATVIIPMVGHHRMFPEFVPSTVLLCLYWSIYRWSYIERRIQSNAQEIVSTLAAILNTSLLLFLFKYQSVRPEWAFYGLLVLGAIELALGQLPASRRRRTAFVILSTIGIILLIAAIPFKYSGMDTAIIWLAEAQMLLLAGVINREILFRGFGLLVALLTSGDMLINQALPILYDHLTRVPPVFAKGYGPGIPTTQEQLALSFLAASLLFYANSLVIPRRWKDLFGSGSESTFFRALSYLASLMLFVSIWLAFALSAITVFWAVTAFILIALARSFSAEDLKYQAHLFTVAVFIRALDLYALIPEYSFQKGSSHNVISTPIVIGLLYLCARWLSLDESSDSSINPSEFYTTAAAILAVGHVNHECDWVWIAAAWGMFALALALVGYFRNRRDLSFQAHFIVLAGFARTLLVNIDATREWHGFTLRFLTFTSMAVLLYLCAYFSGPRGADFARVLSALHTWCGSILIAVLAFEEVSSPWIAVAWAMFAFLLLVIGDRVKRRQLHFQAYLLSISAMVQIAAVNFNAAEPFRFLPSVSLRLVTVSLVAALFYLCARWAAKGEFSFALIAGGAYTWAASGLVIALIYYEVHSYAIAFVWAIFAVVLFEIGVFRMSRNFRAQSYVVFGLSFLRLSIFNLDAGPRDLLLTTLPIAFVFYYVFLRLSRLSAVTAPKAHPLSEGSAPVIVLADPFAFDRQIRAANVLAYLGSATLALFADAYFYGGTRLVAWATLSLIFIAIAWFARLRNFHTHSILLAGFVFFRALGFELQAGGRGFGILGGFPPAFYVSTVAAILFAAQAFAFPLRARYVAASSESDEADLVINFSPVRERSEQIYFFLPMLLVTLLIANEVSFGRVTIGWAIEAVVAFLFALIVSERSFRLAGLTLLLICVGKIGLVDTLRLHGSDRFLNLIIFGAICILISFLYTRYWDVIRRYL